MAVGTRNWPYLYSRWAHFDQLMLIAQIAQHIHVSIRQFPRAGVGTHTVHFINFPQHFRVHSDGKLANNVKRHKEHLQN